MDTSPETITKLKNELDSIQETKNLLKTAITAKGSTVGANDSFRTYVQRVNEIELGKLTNQEYTEALSLANNILGEEV